MGFRPQFIIFFKFPLDLLQMQTRVRTPNAMAHTLYFGVFLHKVLNTN